MGKTATRRAAAAAALLTLALGAGACGDDDDDGGGSSEAPPAATKQLKITMSEEGGNVAYDIPPSVESGYYEITVANDGKKPHAAGIVGLDEGHTVGEAVKAISQEEGGIPTWLHGYGGSGTVAPGQSTTVVQKLEPGSYFLQDDAEDQTEEEDTRAFTVTGGPAEGELPKPAASVVMDEYSFAVKGLKAGTNRILLTNAGKELHHTLAFPIAKGKTIDDVREFAASEGEDESGPPPIDFESGAGTSVLDGGFEQVVDLDLKAGKYALICFLPDRAGGPPHVAKGMLSELDVK